MTKYVLAIYTAFTIALTLIYSLRPDAFAAITIVPAWMWALLLLPLIPVMHRNRKKCIKYMIPCVGAWLLFVVIHVEEPVSILHGILSPVNRDKSTEVIRVVSFNCGGGQHGAFEEIRNYLPISYAFRNLLQKKMSRNLLLKSSGKTVPAYGTMIQALLRKAILRKLQEKHLSPFFRMRRYIFRNSETQDCFLETENGHTAHRFLEP